MRRAGFTLIELIVVVAIIGVMIAGALVSITSGRDAAHVREASRAVSQLSSYANALALLRQRPVVVTYRARRIDVQISGEVVEKDDVGSPAEPIYREVDGKEIPTLAEREADAAEEDESGAPAAGGSGDGGVAEKTGMFFTRSILDPEELAKEDAFREFEDVTLRVEVLDDNGEVLEPEDAARLSLAQPREGKVAPVEDDDEESADRRWDAGDEIPVCITFETNGTCPPHRVYIVPAGVENPDDAAVVMVSRSGKVFVGDEEDFREANDRVLRQRSKGTKRW